ncbi:MAG: DUF4838 domain-containing protein [Kiritimatiellaeota bacterium]|nr:DUF4838 domain-containing protein [Kiritimatiellota bacterium]
MGRSKCYSTITITTDPTNATLSFAASELARCLEAVTGGKARVADSGKGIRVGLMSDFPDIQSPAVPNPELDDAVHIAVSGAVGVIAGINPRSALLGVYRYLTAIGCRWVRPGKDGEYLPKVGCLPDVKVDETASYRHRAVCIEGAVSYEHVRDMVDWIPKVGFNGYFIQFREAHTFFDRWYQHHLNPVKSGDKLSVEDARKYTQGIAGELKKRGMLFHKVGHGWTCEPFGLSGLGWEKQEQAIAPEISRYFAMLNGERKLFGGVAINTNLCYSNPEVRQIINTEIANYATDHPEIDYLHFWLADGYNNNCECESCRKLRPSDWYVRMLNELDELLTGRGIKTRIVFLVYVDLLWPPTREVIKNRDRFVLMFAPITRTYSQAFKGAGTLPEIQAFELNKMTMPKDVDVNLALLKGWQTMFPGDSFDFDYHLMWDHLNDPGHMHIARLIAADMTGLKKIGINGYVSCQIQRIFLPTGLAMTAMGKTLWNDRTKFDDLVADYFNAAFGTDGAACQAYLGTLSGIFDPVFMRGEKPGTEGEAAKRFASVQGHIDAFAPVIAKNLKLKDACQARSWFYLKHHAELTASLAKALQAKAEGNKDKAKALWLETRLMAFQKEEAIHPVFDACLFAGIFDGQFGNVPAV